MQQQNQSFDSPHPIPERRLGAKNFSYRNLLIEDTCNHMQDVARMTDRLRKQKFSETLRNSVRSSRRIPHLNLDNVIITEEDDNVLHFSGE